MNPRLVALVAVSLLVTTAEPSLAKTCPNILLVIDQSGSMAEDVNGVLGNHPTKFEIAQQAVSATIAKYGDRVPFGLELYSASGVVPGTPAADALCFSQTMISIEPPPPTQDRSIASSQILSIVNGAAPVANSTTNTGEAIERAALDPALADPARSNLIVLFTDGKLTCNSTDIHDLMSEQAATFTLGKITAARKLAPSIPTLVIGFDGGDQAIEQSTLDAMALAGGEAPPGCGNSAPCYVSAPGASGYETALEAIIGQLSASEDGADCVDSCFVNGCPNGLRCVQGELDPSPICAPDPCVGKVCTGLQYCREGECVSACDTPCKSGQICRSGTCVADPCWAVECDVGMVCCPLGVVGCATGACVSDTCAATPSADGISPKPCAPPETCEPGTGKCILDECALVTCPANTTCLSGGNCAPIVVSVALASCSCALGQRPDGVTSTSALPLFALLALAVLLRRNTRA